MGAHTQTGDDHLPVAEFVDALQHRRREEAEDKVSAAAVALLLHPAGARGLWSTVAIKMSSY